MKAILKASVRSTLGGAIWAGLLFWSAGTTDWPRAWLHLALWFVAFLVNGLGLARVTPAVLELRLQRDRFAKGYDGLIRFLIVPPILALPVVAGWDAVRYGWAPLSPAWSLPLGALLHVAGDALLLWTMAVNPYLARTVRIQEETDHEVITTGPYRFVRHPMYAGVLLMLAGNPFVLGSGAALAPVLAIAAAMVVRTVCEDRTLREELAGYAEYAARTRHRLVPGVW